MIYLFCRTFNIGYPKTDDSIAELLKRQMQSSGKHVMEWIHTRLTRWINVVVKDEGRRSTSDLKPAVLCKYCYCEA